MIKRMPVIAPVNYVVDGNSIVFFRRSDVISTGDIFDITEYPIIDLKAGGSLRAVIEGLNRLRKQSRVAADGLTAWFQCYAKTDTESL